MYNLLQFVSHRLLFLLLAMAFPCSASLVVPASQFELTEMEKSNETAEALLVTSDSSRAQKDRKTTLVYKLELPEPRKTDAVPRSSVESDFAGHRLLTGDVAPLLC